MPPATVALFPAQGRGGEAGCLGQGGPAPEASQVAAARAKRRRPFRHCLSRTPKGSAYHDDPLDSGRQMRLHQSALATFARRDTNFTLIVSITTRRSHLSTLRLAR